MKAKVAAFERQAQELRSPLIPPTRQTRTKTRLAKENAENATSKLPKPTTPSVEIRYPSKEQTPVAQSIMPTKHHNTHNVLRAQPPSVAKLANVTRQTSGQQPKIRSRDNSAEDLARTKEVCQ